MAIKRADKLRNVVNVAKEIIANPLQTERQIAETLGIDHTTVNAAKKELQQIPPNATLHSLIDGDIEIQKLAQKEMTRRLMEEPNEVPGADLKGFSEITLKRSQLLSGKATDNSTITVKWET